MQLGERMKKFLAVILVVAMTMGCVHSQLYTLPSSKTQPDFLMDREVCSNQSGYGGGHFLFGPLIIILPLWYIFYRIEVGHQKDFQKCMIDKGYACSTNCWDL
jgi:hypothetical protein